MPDDLSDFVEPVIVFNDPSKVRKEPIIKVVPAQDGEINERSFIILDPGLFSVGDEDTLIPATIEYPLPDGTIVLAENYSFRTKNRIIDIENPVVIDGEPMKYKGDINFNKITLRISYPLDDSVYDEKCNVLII